MVFNINRYSLEAGLRGNFGSAALQHQLVLQTSDYHDNLALAGVFGETVTSKLLLYDVW